MKNLTITFALTLTLLFCFSAFREAREVEAMTEKFIRVHILANSDSPEDQALKLKVRDGILACSDKILSGSMSKKEAAEKIEKNLSVLKTAAEDVLKEEGSGYEISCAYEKENFSPRVYDNFTLPAGEYDSLIIKIGAAKGKNWWCVFYPEICLSASSKIEDSAILTENEIKIITSPEKVKYKLLCYEIYLRIKGIFEK